MSLERILTALDGNATPEEVQKVIDELQAQAKAEGRHNVTIKAIKLPIGATEEDIQFAVDSADEEHRKECPTCQAEYEERQKTTNASADSPSLKPNFVGYMIFIQRAPDDEKMTPLPQSFTTNDVDAKAMMERFMTDPMSKLLQALRQLPRVEQRALFTE